MRKRLSSLIFVFFIFFANSASAQLFIGADISYDKNFLNAEISNRPFTNIIWKNGISGSLVILYKINNWLAIQADPSFIQKNSELQRTGFYSGINIERIANHIQLPILARFIFGGSYIKGFFNLGIYEGYWLNGREKGLLPNIFSPEDIESSEQGNKLLGLNKPEKYSVSYSFNRERDNRWEFGYAVGMGILYKISQKIEVFSQVRYYYGITSQQKKYSREQVGYYNNTYEISLGFLVPLTRRSNNP